MKAKPTDLEAVAQALRCARKRQTEGEQSHFRAARALEYSQQTTFQAPQTLESGVFFFSKPVTSAARHEYLTVLSSLETRRSRHPPRGPLRVSELVRLASDPHAHRYRVLLTSLQQQGWVYLGGRDCELVFARRVWGVWAWWHAKARQLRTWWQGSCTKSQGLGSNHKVYKRFSSDQLKQFYSSRGPAPSAANYNQSVD